MREIKKPDEARKESPEAPPSSELFLPNEIWLNIFKRLALQTLLSCIQVSKNWNELAGNEKLFEKILARYFPQETATLQRTQRPISSFKDTVKSLRAIAYQKLSPIQIRLFDACKVLDLQEIERLCPKLVCEDLLALDNHNCPPLYYARRAIDKPIAKEILATLYVRVVKPAYQKNNQVPALNHAINSLMDTETLEELIESGVDINQENGSTPLILSIIRGHIDATHLLLQKGADRNLALIKTGNTPLMIASRDNRIDATRELLDAGASVDLVRPDGVSALFIACESGHAQVAELLLKRGANILQLTVEMNAPLVVAIMKGHADLVQILLQHTPPEVLPLLGPGLMLTTAGIGNVKIMKLLLQAGLNADVTIDAEIAENGANFAREGHMRAIVNANVDMVQIEANGGFQCAIGNTPLFMACDVGNIQMVELLLGWGATMHRPKQDGLTPLRLACQQGQTGVVVELLLEANKRGIPEFLEDIYSLLKQAATLEKNIPILKLLTLHVLSQFIKDSRENTPASEGSNLQTKSCSLFVPQNHAAKYEAAACTLLKFCHGNSSMVEIEKYYEIIKTDPKLLTIYQVLEKYSKFFPKEPCDSDQIKLGL